MKELLQETYKSHNFIEPVTQIAKRRSEIGKTLFNTAHNDYEQIFQRNIITRYMTTLIHYSGSKREFMTL